MAGNGDLGAESTIWRRDRLEAEMNHSLQGWQADAYSSFTRHVLEREFPCPFATDAQKKQELVYAFAASPEQDHDLSVIAEVIHGYLAIVALEPQLVLILFVKDTIASSNLDDYHEAAWRILQYLHDVDVVSWPEKIPRNPSDPMWSFCYDGVPLFFNCSAPAHLRRRSRNLGGALTLVIQPRELFDSIAGNTPKGQQTRHMIRERLMEYDGMPAHPDLGTYGMSDKLEWKQYCLSDDNVEGSRGCPLHIRGQRNESSTTALSPVSTDGRTGAKENDTGAKENEEK